MQKFAFVFYYPLLLFSGPSLSLWPQRPYDIPVHTNNGQVIGHQAPNASHVTEYLGIPYGQPPVGSLRFAEPQKYTAKVHFVASHFSASCPVAPTTNSTPYPLATPQEPRIVKSFGGSNDLNRSDDCLSLNIWSKSTWNKDKPVLVFFYGGRWSIGTTNTPFYSGQYFADAEDVVVVTLNFRINIFGFSGAPGVAQNVGLRDQRLGVEWVRDNIRGFGGDPSKIVIFGQSSGSVAVDYWSYAHTRDPIVSGFIEHSGNAFSFGVNSRELALQHWCNASNLVGCGSSGDVLPCMRSKSITELEAVTTKIKPPPSSNPARSEPIFQPTPDNRTVFENYTALSNSGNFAKLPYLVGQNDNEAGYYKIPAFSQGNILSETQWIDFNNQDFTCSISFESRNRVRHDVPMWRFRYFGDWDNLRLYPTSGAYHGSDLEMVFGASQDVSGLPETAPERQLQATMMHAWASFAENPRYGLERLGWPRYNPDCDTLIRLGFNNDPAPSFVLPSMYDLVCTNITIAG